MRLIKILLLLLITTAVHAQSISSTNFSYLYKPAGEPDFQFHPVVSQDSITFYYTLKGQNPSVGFYVVAWEKRESYSQREGAAIKGNDTLRIVNGLAEGENQVC